jgi:hypothetical protein
MKSLPLFVSIVGLLAATYGASGCSSDSGGTPAPIQTQTQTPNPEFPDDDLAVQLIQLTITLNNEYLNGKPSGVQNVSGACPLAGTVTITGSDSVGETQGIETWGLTFTFAACEYSERQGVLLTLGGALTVNGTFGTSGGPQSGFESLQYNASQLAINGTNQGMESCPVSVNYQSDVSGSGSVTGTICGRTFSNPISSGGSTSSSGG